MFFRYYANIEDIGSEQKKKTSLYPSKNHQIEQNYE